MSTTSYWPPKPYGKTDKRRPGQTAMLSANRAALLATERFTQAKLDGRLPARSAYLPIVFYSVVIHITAHSQVYDSLNASRISKISGVPVKETRRALAELTKLGLLDWKPGKGNQWNMLTLARVSVLTPVELQRFMLLEGATQPPATVEVQGATWTHVQGATQTHNGVLLTTTTSNTEREETERVDLFLETSSQRNEVNGFEASADSAPTTTPITHNEPDTHNAPIETDRVRTPEPCRKGEHLYDTETVWCIKCGRTVYQLQDLQRGLPWEEAS